MFRSVKRRESATAVSAQSARPFARLAVTVAGLAAMATVSGASSPARAADDCVSYSAMACVPSQESAGKYLQVAGRIKFAARSVGAITLFCPVMQEPEQGDGGFYALEMTYLNSDADGQRSKVSANLRRIDEFGGTKTVASVKSQEVFPPSSEFGSAAIEFEHDFDFDNRHYYVQVTLRRSVNDQTTAPDDPLKVVLAKSFSRVAQAVGAETAPNPEFAGYRICDPID